MANFMLTEHPKLYLQIKKRQIHI